MALWLCRLGLRVREKQFTDVLESPKIKRNEGAAKQLQGQMRICV